MATYASPISSFIPQLWAASALEHFRPAEVVAQLMNRQYEGQAVSGNTVKITTLTVGDDTPVQDYKAGGHQHSVDNVNSSTQDLPIDQEKVIAFGVDDVDRIQAAGSMETVTADAAKLLSLDAEAYLISILSTGGTSAGTTAFPGTTSAEIGDDAVNKVLSLRTALSKANVPADSRYLVVNPEYTAALLGASSKLMRVDTSGETSGLRDAIVGRLYGFTIVESNMLTNSNKPAAIALHSSAVAYVNQIQTVEAFRSHTSFQDVLRMLHVYGAKVLRPTAVQVYLSA